MTHSHRLASPTFRQLTLSTLTVTTLLSASACIGHPIKAVEADGSSVKTNPVPLDVNKKVDVLLVIDNSGSMGEEQANLAANFGPFIAELEKAGADYRIGITTTNLGGEGCVGQPDGGDLQLSSCLDRPESFLFGVEDQYDVACAANCQYGDSDLTIRPTAITGDGEALVRPWIESYSGVSNLPDEVDTLDAFACFAPQGISGCGWESPLEAMARALDNAENPSKPEYGFLREDALLAVLFVTDEVDCSLTPGMEAALFDAETFFAEDSNVLTSAACWNAGVACAGASPYDDCWDVNLDAAGIETDDPTQMVLRPISRYVELLEAVAANKTAGREVLVSVIAGVPAGYSSGEAEIVYADAVDTVFEEAADFQAKFGIGAGCQTEIDGAIQAAVPPVRLEVLAEAFPGSGLDEGERNLYSVCDADYTPAILDIVEGISVELPPACFNGCVLDLDDSTPELDYSCEIVESRGEQEAALPECVTGQSGAELPSDADACWIAKTGADLAEECVAAESNLEFELLRRPGVPVASDVEVSAICELSTVPGDCG